MYDQEDEVQLIGQIYLFECPLCFEDLSKDRMVMTNCLHQICDTCYFALVEKKKNTLCPYCKADIGDNKILVHPKNNNQQKKESKV